MDEDYEIVPAWQPERDAWEDYEFRTASELPRLTCGGIGVPYRIDAYGRIIFQ